MIKVIKPGQKEFKGFCDRCGCEFTYEFEDISISGAVECPTCGKHYYHPSKGLTYPNTGWPWPNIGEPIPCNTPDTNPCSNCEWYTKLLKDGGVYVGDTPCTWCKHSQFYCGDTTAVSINDNSTTGTLQLSPEDLKKYNYNIYGYQPTSGNSIPPAPPKSGSNVVKGCNSCQKDTKCNGNKSCKTKQ
jgi:DNA-directed RNA polymerase subunit RPC12/RpoP